MNNKEIRRAAYLLKQWADTLHGSYRGATDSDAAVILAEAEETACLSKKLYALARAKKTPNEQN